jgi:hypothetical protein
MCNFFCLALLGWAAECHGAVPMGDQIGEKLQLSKTVREQNVHNVCFVDAEQGRIVGAPRATATQQHVTERRDSVRRALTFLVGELVKTLETRAADDNEGVAAAQLMTAWLLDLNADGSEFEQVRPRFRAQADRILAADLHSNSNWFPGFVALYAYERSLRDRKANLALDRVARGFIKRQNSDGGWFHWGGYSSIAYPATLIATTNLGLFALGAAEREGMAVCKTEPYKKAVSKGLKLLHDVQGPHGGMPYGGRPSRWNYEAGRTAGMLAALAALRQTDSKVFQRAASYVQHNVDVIMNGHGGTAFHVAIGALGCYILSDDVWQLYESRVLKRVLKEQRKDGSFGGEKYSIPITPSFSTAFFALGLMMDRTEVARKLRLSMPFKLASEEKRSTLKFSPPAWQLGLDNVVALQADEKMVVAMQADGTVVFSSLDSGKLLGKVRLPMKVDQLKQHLMVQDGKAIVAIPSETSRLLCCDPKKETPEWQTEVRGTITSVTPSDDRVIVLASGKVTNLVTIALATGQILRSFPVRGAGFSGAAWRLPCRHQW